MAFASLLPIMPIIPPIIIIGIVVIIFGEILYEIVINFPKLLDLLKTLTDPEIFMRDLTYGIFTGIQLVILSCMDLKTGKPIIIFLKKKNYVTIHFHCCNC